MHVFYFIPGKDITATNYSNIPRNATEIVLDSITIVNDNVPETNEEFTLSLGEHEGLSILLSDLVVILTIVDDDGIYTRNVKYLLTCSLLVCIA